MLLRRRLQEQIGAGVDEEGNVRFVRRLADRVDSLALVVDGEKAVAADHLILQIAPDGAGADRSEEHTSELQSLMRISYAVFCLKKKNNNSKHHNNTNTTY